MALLLIPSSFAVVKAKGNETAKTNLYESIADSDTEFTYQMSVGSSISLKKLLTNLGIDCNDVTKVSSVSSANPQYLSVDPQTKEISVVNNFTDNILVSIVIGQTTYEVSFQSNQTETIYWNIYNNTLYISTVNYCAQNPTNMLIYQWNMDGNVPWMAEEYRNKIKHVIVEGNVRPASITGWFGSSNSNKALASAESLDLRGLDTSLVTSMANVFSQLGSCTSIDLTNFNTSNVTNMSNMFASSSKIVGLDLSSFNTSNVTNMSNMFFACSKLKTLDISSFDTHNITNFSLAFGSTGLESLDISHFDFSSATSLNSMLFQNTSLTSIILPEIMNTVNVTQCASMFRLCKKLKTIDISGMRLDNCTSMESMFEDCIVLESVKMPKSDSPKLSNIMNMFSNCGKLTSLDLSYLDTRKITNNYTDWLKKTSSLTQITVGENWTVTCFDNSPFVKWKSLNDEQIYDYDNIPIGGNTYIAEDSETIYWVVKDEILYLTSKEENINNILGVEIDGQFLASDIFDSGSQRPWESKKFQIKQVKVGDMVADDIVKPLYMKHWFNNFTKLENVDFSGLDSSLCRDMSYLYFECKKLPIDKSGVDYLNACKVEDMSYMFYNCASFAYLDFSTNQNLVTPKLKNMDYMFYGIKNAAYIDISPLDTRNVTKEARSLFKNCNKVEYFVFPSNFLSNYNGDCRSYFENCYELVSVDLSSASLELGSNGSCSAMFANCYKLKSVDISRMTITPSTSNIVFRNDMFKNCNELESITVGARYKLGYFPDIPNQMWKGSVDGDNHLATEIPGGIAQTYVLENGETYYWALDENGLLTISKDENIVQTSSRSGEVSPGKRESQPWASYAANIRSVKVDDAAGKVAPFYTYNWFKGLIYCKDFDLSGLDMTDTISAYGMFNDCSAVTTITLPETQTTKLLDTGYMFNGCSKLISIDFGGLNTSKATDMSYMFNNCSSIEELDLSTIENKCDAVTNMLSGLKSLKKITLSQSLCKTISNLYFSMPSAEYIPGIVDGKWFDENGTAYGQVRDMQLNQQKTYVVGYCVSFDVDGGQPEIEDRIVGYGNKVGNVDTVTKYGYTFQGWMNGNEYFDIDNDVIKDATTLVAQWKINEYNINYVVDGTDYNNPNPQSFTVFDLPLSLQDADKSGYTFSGWFSDANYQHAYTTIPAGTMEDVTVYGKFTVNSYTVRFNANGGSGTMSDQQFTYDVSQPLRQNEFTWDSEHIFSGWALTANGEKVYTDQQEVKNLTTEDNGVVDLYAFWIVRPAYEYTISHYQQQLDDSYLLVESEYKTGLENDEIDHNAYYKSYAGFNKVADNNTYVVPGNDDLVIKLYYDRYTYNVEVVADNGTALQSNCSASGTYKYGETVKLSAVARDTYQWDKWQSSLPEYVADQSENEVDVVLPAMEDNTTIKFTAKATCLGYVIVYDLDGGSVNGENPAGYTAETETFTLINPTKLGYKFIGWTGTDLTENTMTVTIEQGSQGDRSYKANYELIIYNINYHLTSDATNDPYNPTTYDITYGEITIHDPTRNGYDFKGFYWNEDCSGEKVTSIAEGTTGDIDLYPSWEVATYTITWHDNGANYNPNAHKVSYNIFSETYQILDAQKNGYTFIGWYDAEFNGNLVTEITTGTTGDLDFYARYSANEYNIILHYSEDTVVNEVVKPNNRTKYKPTDALIIIWNPSCEGYEFAGWISAENDTPVKNMTIPSGSYGDKEFTAVWKPNSYTITYNLDGGTNHPENRDEYTYVTETFEIKAPTRVGYKFEGWQMLDDEELHQIVTVEQYSMGDIELTAMWTPVTYTITYNLDGGTNNPANRSEYQYEDDTFVIEAPTKLGYKFEGWQMLDDEGLYTTVTVEHHSTGNIELTANWTLIKYTITYNLDGGTNHPDNPFEYTYEDEYDIKAPTKEGYQFSGWKMSGDDELHQNITIEKHSTGDIELTAEWTPVKYRITYYLNGGRNNPNNPSEYTYETRTFDIKAPTKQGYLFEGWRVENGSLQYIVTISTHSMGNRELTAEWTPINYTITYILDGGTNDPENRNEYTYETETFSIKAPTKEGYQFSGWKMSDGTVQTEVTVQKYSTGNIELTATWTKNVTPDDPVTPDKPDDPQPIEIIDSNDTPLMRRSSWALVDVCLAAISSLIAAIRLKKSNSKLVELISPVVGIVLLFVTQNFKSKMVIVDKWVIAFAITLLATIVVSIFNKDKDEQQEEQNKDAY